MKFNNVFVDADSLLYSVGFATQKNIYRVWVQGHQGDPSFVCTNKRWLNKILKDEDHELHRYLFVQPFFSASTTIDAIISAYKKKFGTDNIHLYFTGKDNFRDKVATLLPYKGNRNAEKPAHYQKIKEYCIKKYNAKVIDGQEADDAVSIAQTLEDQGTSVIVSIDKDLDMVQGYHYNPMKDKMYRVTKLEGLRSFYEQLLQGDLTTDNIPGIKGIGKVGAKKLLENCTSVQEMEEVCLGKYSDQYGEYNEKYMTEVGQLLWMRVQKNQMWYPEFLGGCRIE